MEGLNIPTVYIRLERFGEIECLLVLAEFDDDLSRRWLYRWGPQTEALRTRPAG